ncbi:hypothetical protein [Cellulosilyticum lentocellum]|uniref:Uncharacterized protein n=1 Tax=Cellulosilyticum lentocellum (strain ATCC 49066 / DSM 5427 / NCIMB 11756 / RHM5) TaxID=642492 RepID=F2JNV7_CELLD|nr:hypothetical protein [Cellulosilyticum lentocellum]ADZ82455.1 hypothetical protein Clole_0722 [Cellulosilyticum lentocellum DSM 5427]
MGMKANVGGTKEQVERKIRILKSLIAADKNKGDSRSLEHHSKALNEHEKYLKEVWG